MDIEQLADACGGLAWISERLFQLEGQLAGEVEALDPRIRALLARSSRRHGQHAQWWRGLLPDSPALNAAARIGPPTQAWGELFAHIEEWEPADAVSAIHEVALLHLEHVLDHLQDEFSPISDGAFIRMARMVRADLDEEHADTKEAWPTPKIPSSLEIDDLLWGFINDYREKRWPPLVTHRR